MKQFVLLFAFLCAMSWSVQATDISVSASQIPFSQPPNIGAAQSISVTATNGSTTLTSSALFRTNWPAGIILRVNSVNYYLSSVETTSSLTLTSNFASSTGSYTATVYPYILLRLFATQRFTPNGAAYVVQPGSPGGSAWYKQVGVSIISNTAYLPALTIPATTDAVNPIERNARWMAFFYTAAGGQISPYSCFEQFAIPASPASTSWTALCIYNTPSAPVSLFSDRNVYTQSQTYNKVEIDGLIAAAGLITGSGSTNTITKWTGTSTLGTSSLTDDGTTVQSSVKTQVGGASFLTAIQSGEAFSVQFKRNASNVTALLVNGWVGNGNSSPFFKLSTDGSSNAEAFLDAPLEMAAQNSAPVSGANRGKIKYNSGTQQFEQSVNGGAYVPFSSSAINALTGDVTASGTGSVTATIANDAVTYAKLQNVTDNRLLGRSAGSSGDAQEIQIGSGLSLSGGTLSATGGGIGGTLTSPRVPYATGSSTLGDNAQFVWDNTNATLQVGNVPASVPGFSGVKIAAIRETSGNTQFASIIAGMYSSSQSLVFPTLVNFRARGTAASPAAVQDGDSIGRVEWLAQFNTAAGNWRTGAYFEAVATAAHSNGEGGTSLRAYATLDGSTTPREIFRTNEWGAFILGAQANTSSNTANNKLVVTTPSSAGARGDVVAHFGTNDQTLIPIGIKVESSSPHNNKIITVETANGLETWWAVQKGGTMSSRRLAASTSSSSHTIDWANGNVQQITLNHSVTSLTNSNLTDGTVYTFVLIQDGTGSRTITWPAAFKWTGGAAPTLTTTAGAKDVFTFYSDGTNLYERSRALDVK